MTKKRLDDMCRDCGITDQGRETVRACIVFFTDLMAAHDPFDVCDVATRVVRAMAAEVHNRRARTTGGQVKADKKTL